VTWVKLDDRMADHPKLLGLGDDYEVGLAVYVAGLCYCGEHLTDGRIPRVKAHTLTPSSARIAPILVAAGLWLEDKGSYVVNDYLEYNPSKEKVKSDRKATAERVKKWKESRNGDGNAVSNGVSNGVGTPAPYPYPYPSLEEPETPRSKDKPLSRFKELETVDTGLLSYWMDKAGRDPEKADITSLRVLEKNHGPDIVKLAIGQAVVQGVSPDNYALITSIAKAEVS
jgi:hypothetical protein